MHRRDIALLASFGVLISCSILSPEGDAAEMAATYVAQTESAREAVAEEATEEPAATETFTPTTSPTVTATPTQAPTATPEGPLSIDDDFSSQKGIWAECEFCSVKENEMRMGPFPVSHAFQQNWAICDPCGMVTTYTVTVDVRFIEGPSERGFGLVLGLNPDGFYTFEVTPWQTVDLWHLDFEAGEWEWVNGTFAGAVRTGNQYNSLRLEASENSAGRIDYSLGVNGSTPLVIFNRAVDPGWLGLTLYGHAVEVRFDNFSFETEETPIFPNPGETQSG